jgi:predicted SnoaL-like aldol condensation-catalyzing enzyme
MTQNNMDVLRGYFDEVIKHKNVEKIPEYFSEKFIGHSTPYVGLGVIIDASSGVKVTIQVVKPGSPAEGKLEEGDEILRVSDGERILQTFDELRQTGWGQGALGTSLTVWVRREGVEHKIDLTRGMVQGFEIPYQVLKRGFQEFFDEWPDLQVRFVNIIESGSLIAYHIENQGQNSLYGRSAVWAEFGFVRIQDGKITDWWSVEDSLSQFKQIGYTILEPARLKV